MKRLPLLLTIPLAALLVLPAFAQPGPAVPAAPAVPATPATPAAPATPATPLTLETEQQKGSYAFGMNVGRNIAPIAKQLDIDLFVRALRDQLEGKEAAMTDAEGRDAFMAFQETASKAAQAESMKAGKEFLANNAKNDADIVQLVSGLQYKVVTAGEGAKPKATDTVEVHYTGTLIDGTKFDSSRDRGTPATFPVNGVIAGWTEALQLMPVGSRWTLFVPGDLAYGERGSPPRIPPNSVLVFDVELMSIK